MSDHALGGTEVALTIPAATDHIRFARLMASAVASRAGLDYDTIEDLRIAVSELCTAAIEIAEGGRLTLTYRADADGIRVEGHASAAPVTPPSDVPGELTLQILDAVADEHSFEVGPEGVAFGLLRRVTAAP
jgi:serine/threonine-protein kinase RsbW